MNVKIASVNPYEAQLNLQTKIDNIGKKLLSKAEYDMLMSFDDSVARNQDAIVLSVLHDNFGFTAQRLIEFYRAVYALTKEEETADAARCHYGEIPQIAALKEIGVDIKALEEEVNADA